MGYGNDDSEMIIVRPILTHTLTTLIKFAASESDFTTYGGNNQLIAYLASTFSVNSEYIKVISSS
jgi:hypothetical protein